MELPPLEAGGVKLTDALALRGVAVIPVGEPGTAAGITGLEATDAGPGPTELIAVTVNV